MEDDERLGTLMPPEGTPGEAAALAAADRYLYASAYCRGAEALLGR